MSCYSKEKFERCDYNNVCRSHSARSDRELYRICPSKLSKRELEDLYFALLENNLELKRTINGQQDKIRSLSTKVQRMTAAQKSLKSKEMKDCCVGTRSIINEQKDSITELKEVNQRMAEKIQMLNMRLCSAKQFYKKTPGLCTSRCLRCSGNSTSKKLDCSPKPSENVEKTTVSSQNLDRETISVKSAATETRELERLNPDLPCDENKCRTTMEELKQKIVSLQEELCTAHGEYSSRISRLEEEVRVVRRDNVRVRSERRASLHDLTNANNKAADLLTGLRAAEAKCAELSTELSIERRKVAELETRLKAASMSDRVNKAIEEHLTTMNDTKDNKARTVADYKTSSSVAPCACYPREKEKRATTTRTKDIKIICGCPAPTKHPTPKKESRPKCICGCCSTPLFEFFKASPKKNLTCICECPPQPMEENEVDIIRPDPDNILKTQAAQKPSEMQYSPKRMSEDIAKLPKPLDDSGFVEANKSHEEEGLQKINQDLLNRLNELQNQVKTMQNSGAEHYARRIERQKAEISYAAASKTADDQIYKASGQHEMFEGHEPTANKAKEKLGITEDFESKTTDTAFGKSNSDRSMPSKSDLIFGNPDSILNEKQAKNKINLVSDQQQTESEIQTVELETNKKIETVVDESKPTATKLKESSPSSPVAQEPDSKTNLPKPALSHKCWDQDKAEASTNSELCKVCNVCTYENKCELQTCVDEKSNFRCEGPKQNAVRNGNNDAHNKWQIPGPLPADQNGCFKNLQASDPLELSERDHAAPIITKNDQHNSFQIPGPMPVAENKHGRRTSIKRASLDKKKDSLKNDKENEQKKRTDMISETVQEQVQTIDMTDTKIGVEVPNISKYVENATIGEIYDETKTPEEIKLRRSRDSLEVNRERLIDTKVVVLKLKDNGVDPINDISMQNYYSQSDQTILKKYSAEHCNQIEKTERGTQDQPFTEQNIESQVQAEKPQRIGRVSVSEQGTYTVNSSKQTRSTSPENTECEISYMTDLPSERSPKSPNKRTSRSLSPGEDKQTTTYTDSFTSPATNYTLSEGEMPSVSPRRPSYPYGGQRQQNNNVGVPTSDITSQKMEAALQAISEELARCKTLLLSQRSPEARRQSQASMSSHINRPIELRRGVATQSIGDTYAPKCIFTLHIGTVVLSDEAVLMSRNKNLVLTWKFYDQNVAMSRMRTGRVVLFDFSTEYDIKITENFLDYMKHEEMPILICELDKQDEPFATCKLPLRDALLHTNRRADISLALVAGPQMISARAANNAAADALDAGDEMGVIDLWCMLRADAKHLPAINRAIARHSPPMINSTTRTSRIMPQVLDDDPSNEFADMDLSLQTKIPPLSEAEGGKNLYKDVEYARSSVPQWGSSLFKFPATIDIDGPPQQTKAQQTNTPTYDPNNYPAVGRSSCGAPHLIPSSPPEPDNERDANPAPSQPDYNLPKQDSSEIIVNEVVAKIKSPEDMRHVLHKSSLQHEFTRLPKSEEQEGSQAPSVGSLRSIVARLQKNPKHGNKHQQTDVPRRSSLGRDLRRNSKEKRSTSDTPTQRPLTVEETNDIEIYKKYDNISKWIGANRSETSKKSVTIVPKYVDTVPEEPQRDIPQPTEEEIENQPRLEITVLWLALNEECEAMINPHVQRVYVAYSFLGRNGAELETPVSLPKPKHYVDKCYFNFKKTFLLQDSDLPLLGHMARCRAASRVGQDEKDCIVFSVVSEPPEDPLGLESCEDIGYAYLYLGDLLAYSTGSTGYTEVVPVHAAHAGDAVCGVLAVRLDGLDIVRRCLITTTSHKDLAEMPLP